MKPSKTDALSAPPSSLRNLGPKSDAMLALVGVHSSAQLMQSDALDLYRKLRKLDSKVSLNLLYALIGAQEGRDWRVVMRDRKLELLMQLDDAQTTGRMATQSGAPSSQNRIRQ
jgi:DNA transformation protein and related proteins